jgi:hypothetical protein
MSDIFEKYARIRTLYPDDIARIEGEENLVKKLLQEKDYSQLESTRILVKMCRDQVLECRKKLATHRGLTTEQIAELWSIIDARLWFIEMVSKDFDAELQAIEQSLDSQLTA